MDPQDDDTVRKAWGYAIGGVVGVSILLVCIIFAVCRQHYRDQEIEKQKKAVQAARIAQLQHEANSFTNVAFKSDSDILARLGMSPLRPTSTPTQDSQV